MRAPPDALTETSGTPCSAALSQARANFSPTALPIEPPMNAKSMTASSQALPSIAPRPITIASPRPVFSSASARRSRVGPQVEEVEWVVRAEVGGLLDEAALVGEADAMRARARIGKWWPHCEQTQSASSSSSSRKCEWHFGQVFGCFSRPRAGTSLVSTWTSMPGSDMTEFRPVRPGPVTARARASGAPGAGRSPGREPGR